MSMFMLLDTMGFLQEVSISKDSVSCTAPFCRGLCHHSTWSLHKVFSFDKDEPLIFKKDFTNSEWKRTLAAFPVKVLLVKLPTPKKDKHFLVNVRNFFFLNEWIY